MKKLSMILLAVFLVFATAGQAAAYFEKNQLVQTVYNDEDIEAAMDLGNLGSFDFSGTNLLADAGTVPWADLKPFADLRVGYYCAQDGYQNWFTTTQTVAPTVVNGGLVPFQNQASIIAMGYQGNMVAPGVAEVPVGDTQSYDNLMNDGSTSPGVYAGFNFNWVDGESSLADLATVGYVDMFLYDYYMNVLVKGVDPSTDYSGVLRLYADGSTVLNPTVVPIPGAAILLGSGLLGLVGIRRRNT